MPRVQQGIVDPYVDRTQVAQIDPEFLVRWDRDLAGEHHVPAEDAMVVGDDLESIPALGNGGDLEAAETVFRGLLEGAIDPVAPAPDIPRVLHAPPSTPAQHELIQVGRIEPRVAIHIGLEQIIRDR